MLSEARLKFLEKTKSAKGTTKKLVLHWEGFFFSLIGSLIVQSQRVCCEHNFQRLRQTCKSSKNVSQVDNTCFKDKKPFCNDINYELGLKCVDRLTDKKTGRKKYRHWQTGEYVHYYADDAQFNRLEAGDHLLQMLLQFPAKYMRRDGNRPSRRQQTFLPQQLLSSKTSYSKSIFSLAWGTMRLNWQQLFE